MGQSSRENSIEEYYNKTLRFLKVVEKIERNGRGYSDIADEMEINSPSDWGKYGFNTVFKVLNAVSEYIILLSKLSKDLLYLDDKRRLDSFTRLFDDYLSIRQVVKEKESEIREILSIHYKHFNRKNINFHNLCSEKSWYEVIEQRGSDFCSNSTVCYEGSYIDCFFYLEECKTECDTCEGNCPDPKCKCQYAYNRFYICEA